MAAEAKRMQGAVDMEYDMAFASNYMILRRDQIGLKGLYRLWSTRKPEKRQLYFASRRKETLAVVDAGLLFLSAILQWLLMWIEKPMAWLGSFLEMLLNILSNNGGGFFRMFLRILRGKFVIPEKDSANYCSMIAHMDRRVDIDSSLKKGEERYYEALALLASKIAYENPAYVKSVVENHWKMEFLGAFNFWNDFLGDNDTQAFLMREKLGNSEMIIVAFRGTEPFNAVDWCSDADVSWFKIDGMGKMHAGFMKALGLQRHTGWPKEKEQDPGRPTAYYYLRERLREMLQANPNAKFIVTGHSLGGALAIVFPSVLVYHQETDLLKRLKAVYTFGQPRVGDFKFGEFVMKGFRECGVKYLRFVYSNDMVPRVPFDNSGYMYKHFGRCVFYDAFYKGRLIKEEPFKNYFSIFGIIPMALVAIWEIVRGFVYPYFKGPIYREGWLLFSMRLFGLLMPGMPAHIPQDYHNSTQLGQMIRRLRHKIKDKVTDALQSSDDEEEE